MHIEPSKDTQKASLQTFQHTEHNHGDLTDGPSFRFDHRAADFVPGGPTKQAKQELASEGRPAAASREPAGDRVTAAVQGIPERPAGGLRKQGTSQDSSSSQVDRRPQAPSEVASWSPPDQFFTAAALGRSPPGRQYTSANHLLNFKYAPRSQGGGHQGAGASRGRGQGHRSPFNRELFLQANFRFVVSDTADLGKHLANADLMPDWDDVIEVQMPVTSPLQCPISLETPVQCPQITPCGHVFGFVPIMGYLLSHGGQALRKACPCPLCFVPIAARELRLLRFQHIKAPQIGDTIALQLLQRPANSILPIMAGSSPPGSPTAGPASVPADPSWALGSGAAAASQVQQDPPALWGGADTFAKFTRVHDPAPLWREPVHSLAAMGVQVTEEGGSDAVIEAPAIYAALDALAQRVASWTERQHRSGQPLGAHPAEGVLSPEEAAACAVRAVKQEASVAAAEAAAARAPKLTGKAAKKAARAAMLASAAEAAAEVAAEAAATAAAANTKDEPAEPEPTELASASQAGAAPGAAITAADQLDDRFFYQAADGQWIFLTQLDLRVLAAEHGGLASCPARLEAVITDMDTVMQTEATRRRFKRMSHVPLTGCFTLIDIKPSLVASAAALEPFAKELAGRERRRQQRLAQGRVKDEAEAAAAAAAAAAARPPNEDQLRAMPSLNGSGFLVSGQDDGILAAETQAAQQQLGDGISFAHMTRMGYAASGPTVSHATGKPEPAAAWGPSSPPVPLRGAWGQQAAASSSSPGSSSGAHVPTLAERIAANAAQARAQPSSKGGKKKLVLLTSSQRRY